MLIFNTFGRNMSFVKLQGNSVAAVLDTVDNSFQQWAEWVVWHKDAPMVVLEQFNLWQNETSNGELLKLKQMPGFKVLIGESIAWVSARDLQSLDLLTTYQG